MKRMIFPLRGLDLLDHRLEPVLELAAELRSCHHRRQVERDEPLVLERLGHIPAHDAMSDALDDRRLADAGLADEHGVVLGAPREHLDGATDLLVAADHRIDLSASRHLRQIARVLLEGLEFPFRIAIGDALIPAHGRERRQHLVVGEAGLLQDS